MQEPRSAPGEGSEDLIRPHHAFDCPRVGEGTDTAHDRSRPDSSAEQRGAHGRVRTASGDTHHREAFDPKVVREVHDIGRPVDQPASELERAQSVARPIRTDEPQSRGAFWLVISRVAEECQVGKWWRGGRSG